MNNTSDHYESQALRALIKAEHVEEPDYYGYLVALAQVHATLAAAAATCEAAR